MNRKNSIIVFLFKLVKKYQKTIYKFLTFWLRKMLDAILSFYLMYIHVHKAI